MEVLAKFFPRIAGQGAAVDTITPPPAASTHNPYLAARKEWDERYGDLITRARNWRAFALLVAAVALVQASGLIYLSGKSKVVPFVVAVDSLARVVAAGPAHPASALDERLVRAALYEWIGDLRLVTTDGVAQGYFTRNYHVVAEIVTTNAGAAVLNGRRRVAADLRLRGPCPAGMAPGDMVLAGGRKVKVSDLAGGSPG